MPELIIFVSLSVTLLRVTRGTGAEPCFENKIVYNECGRSETYYTSCGFWGGWRCSKTRIVHLACGSNVQGCCSGYSGNDCLPVCTTACRNGGVCEAPDTCNCQDGFAKPFCDDIDECSINNGDCSDMCDNSDGTFICRCQSGYSISDDRHACIDTDECASGNGECGQQCTNTQGSYECSCNDGFELDSDLHLCNDIDECVVTYKDGCQDICTNIPGSFECSCHDGSPTNPDGMTCEGSTDPTDVFTKYSINGKRLPRGCSTLQLIPNTIEMHCKGLLSSTSPWYQHSSTLDVLYTHGIVFVETDGLVLPLSLSGITVANGTYSVGLPKYTASEGILYSVDDRQGTDCLTVNFTIADINDFLQAHSFLITYFHNQAVTFPNFIEKKLIALINFESHLSYGSQIDHISSCRGSPMKSSSLYHVLLLGWDFQLSVYGDLIPLPKPTNEETVCIIIDLCKDSGTTWFVMLPETLKMVVPKLFQALDIELIIRGFAVSLNSSMDSVCDNPVFDNANLWVGADYRISTGILELQGSADLFIGVPSIKNILTAPFEGRWDILFDLTGTTNLRLEFQLFGGTVVIEIPEIAALKMESYATFGGLQDRTFCDPEAIGISYSLGRFLSIQKEYCLGAAFSVDTVGLFLVQTNVKVTFLGLVSVSADLFISNDGISMIFEARIWNHFIAHLTVSAELHKALYDPTFSVIGKLLANSGNNDNFQDSYLSAIRKIVNDIGASANKRLTEAQGGLRKAQNIVGKAQAWLEKKKAKLDDANIYFDNAVDTLEVAKRNVEDEKEPFRNVLAHLREKQRDIDRFCRIRSCRSICIPGLRPRWCQGWWGIRYPCSTWTSCMSKVPDLICIARNAFCKLVRGIVYLVLEFAKIFVRTVMFAFDIANAAFTAAQVVVDKSRVVLDVAKVAFSVAQIGLDAVKGVLEVAILALEDVKIAVNIVIQVFNYVIRHGLQKLIDIKNCQFKIEIKTTDFPVFSATCDIKVLDSVWVTVPVFVNFRRLLQSLWQAVKIIVERLFGRTKREIEYATKSFTSKILRQTRDADINVENLISTVNETMSSLHKNLTNDCDYRVLTFIEICAHYNNIFISLNKSMQALLEQYNENSP